MLLGKIEYLIFQEAMKGTLQTRPNYIFGERRKQNEGFGRDWGKAKTKQKKKPTRNVEKGKSRVQMTGNSQLSNITI